jgi:Mn-dependent transcriptional regulator
VNIATSMEDYLKAILILENQGKEVRSIDVVRHIGYSKSTVCCAMQELEK